MQHTLLRKYDIKKIDLVYYKKSIDYDQLTEKGKTIYDEYQDIDTESIAYRIEESIKTKQEEEYLDLNRLELTCIPCHLEITLCYLFISDNKLTSLGNLSNLINLKVLDCGNNELSYLNNLPKNIVELVCSGNKLSTLDTSYLPYLKILDCSSNNITSLIYGNLLTSLECDNNKLTTLPSLKSFLTMKMLTCSKNNLSYVPEYPNLKMLDCSDNKIEKINNLSSLEELYCDKNNISSITNLPQIKIISCIENEDIALPYFNNLSEITCDYTLDVNGATRRVSISSKYKVINTNIVNNYVLIFFDNNNMRYE